MDSSLFSFATPTALARKAMALFSAPGAQLAFSNAFAMTAAPVRPSAPFHLIRTSLSEISELPMTNDVQAIVNAPRQPAPPANSGFSLAGWAIMGASVVVIGGVTYLLIKWLVTDEPISPAVKRVLMRGQAYAAGSLALIAAPTVLAKMGVFRATPLISAFYGGGWPQYVLPWLASVSLWIAAAAIPNRNEYKLAKRSCWAGASVLTGLLAAPMAIFPWSLLSIAGTITLGVVIPTHVAALAASSSLVFWLVSPLAVATSAAALAIFNPAARLLIPFTSVAMLTAWLIIADDTMQCIRGIRDTDAGSEADDVQVGVRITAVSLYAFVRIMLTIIEVLLASKEKKRRDDE
eukprot:c17139_g1_i1.p1 GENE.c17139_g1_i1~~c17139_g1_i1.p1  ORF type:complete len:359 (+),score=72.18 c17139_g1_i1:33-1079(+)